MRRFLPYCLGATAAWGTPLRATAAWGTPLGATAACIALLAGLACQRAETAPLAPEPAVETAQPVVVFLGDSLTAGYGLPAEQAFPALIQQRIDAEGLDYRVVNAGVSGDTSAGGLRRTEWLLQLPVAVLVLGLGANDMLRGLGVDEMRRNLQAIIERFREVHPRTRVVIAGMRAPPNLGRGYVRAFEEVYPALARENDAALVPFLLEGVAGRPSLNQTDGIHPTAGGHHRVADTVWEVLAPVLRSEGAG